MMIWDYDPTHFAPIDAAREEEDEWSIEEEEEWQ
jgi:hypothetical protein